VPLPKLRDAEIAWIIQQVAEYIGRQRQTYREKALPLDAHQRSAMQAWLPTRRFSSLGSSTLMSRQRLAGGAASTPLMLRPHRSKV
jgi:hypothetical protein